MSRDRTTANLKLLLKTRVAELSPEQYSSHLGQESDRATMILSAAMVEDFLVHALEWRMPSLNKEEHDRIFNFEGPLGSFSNRIRLAHGLGIIDRTRKRALEIIKEIRNVAAHAHAPLNFDTPAIRAAILALLPTALRARAEKMTGIQLSFIHAALCTSYANDLMGHEKKIAIEEIMETATAVPSKGRRMPIA